MTLYKRDPRWDDYDEITISCCRLIAISRKALLVRHAGREYWIPKSQICLDKRFGIHGDRIDVVSSIENVGDLVIPKWLYLEKMGGKQ